VAVTVSLVNEMLSVPCAYRLYLPEEWAEDRERRAAVGVPQDVGFQKKWQIAVDSIDRLRAEDLPLAPVIADAGYGNTTEFREALATHGLVYAVAVGEETSVWPPGQEPLPPAPWTGRGARLSLPLPVSFLEAPSLPEGFQPRGAASAP
jgi:SRSO17 transposase